MSRKQNVLSIAMEEDMREFLRTYADSNNTNVSEVIRSLVEAHLIQNKKVTVVQHDPDTIPLVLKIPVRLRGDRAGVQQWLAVRCGAIVDRLAQMEQSRNVAH